MQIGLEKRNKMTAFSYFEYHDQHNDIYVSLFKTTKTTFDSTKMPLFKQKALNVQDLADQLIALQRNNLGFFDTFWFMKRKDSYSLGELTEWMDSLYYVPSDNITEHYGVCYIQSHLDPLFEIKVYVKSTSLPQEAIDVIPIFKSEENEEIFVMLGQKKKSPLITVFLGDGAEVDILSVGMYGTIIFGEHLEESEKKRMTDLRSIFLQKNNTEPVKINDQQISPVLRTLLEESGFKLSSLNSEVFYVHYDNRIGRDIRYYTYKINDYDQKYFGYCRQSASDTVLVVIKGRVPDVLPDPLDAVECGRPFAINKSRLLGLLNSGYLNLAFHAHSAQLQIALNSLNR